MGRDQFPQYSQGAGVAEPDRHSWLYRQRGSNIDQQVFGDQIRGVGRGPGGVAVEKTAHLAMVDGISPSYCHRIKDGGGGRDGGGEQRPPLQRFW